MRKISLTDGRLSVEILPDCGGAISALRWISPAGKTFDLLRTARAEDIAERNADQMSCIPVAPATSPENGLAEWIVQDASNIRATLTLHQEAGENEALQSSYQLLQRLALDAKGLRIDLTVTNIGTRPLAARTGLRLHPDWRGESILRGNLTPVDMDGKPSDDALHPTTSDFAAGFRFGGQDVDILLRHLRPEIQYEWPEERLALMLNQIQGNEYVRLEYKANQHDIWLTSLSHPGTDNADTSGTSTLQKGDSLSASLLLSPIMLA